MYEKSGPYEPLFKEYRILRFIGNDQYGSSDAWNLNDEGNARNFNG